MGLQFVICGSVFGVVKSTCSAVLSMTENLNLLRTFSSNSSAISWPLMEFRKLLSMLFAILPLGSFAEIISLFLASLGTHVLETICWRSFGPFWAGLGLVMRLQSPSKVQELSPPLPAQKVQVFAWYLEGVWRGNAIPQATGRRVFTWR